VAEANVTIFKIDARNKDEETDDSFVVLMEQEIKVNLLELTNGITETLVDTEVPVGMYDLVRVYVKGVNVVLTDGTSYNLDVPSGEQTGIKLFIKPGLTVNGRLSADLEKFLIAFFEFCLFQVKHPEDLMQYKQYCHVQNSAE
jgi:hypothetical protein